MGLSVLLSCCELILGVTFELLQGHEALSPVEGDIGVFANGSSTPGVPLKFQGENGLLLRCSGKVGIPFLTKQGNGPSCRDKDGRRGSDYVVLGNSVFLLSETGMSRNFLSCIKGVKYPLKFQEGMGNFSRDTSVRKGLIWR